jgi:hypothetical protein
LAGNGRKRLDRGRDQEDVNAARSIKPSLAHESGS